MSRITQFSATIYTGAERTKNRYKAIQVRRGHKLIPLLHTSNRPISPMIVQFHHLYLHRRPELQPLTVSSFDTIVVASPQSEQTHCSACQASLVPGNAYCHNCGASVHPDAGYQPTIRGSIEEGDGAKQSEQTVLDVAEQATIRAEDDSPAYGKDQDGGS